jgi:transketolase
LKALLSKLFYILKSSIIPTMEPLSVEELQKTANTIRKDIVTMVYQAGSGHPGGSLSSADIMTVLFFNVLTHDPKNPEWEDRDRFILSKGHCTPVLYATLARVGYFSVEELSTYRKLRSRLQGHPSRKDLPFLEASTGSLGQGLSIAVGMALAAKHDQKNIRIYALMGDGEQDEGQVWEAALAAAHYKLDNLCAIIDNNHLQIDGDTREIMDTDPLEEKYRSFGWHVLPIEGHSIAHLLQAFGAAKNHKGRPVLILAKTIKGKGVSFMENQAEWHGKAPNKEQFDRAMEELNRNG